MLGSGLMASLDPLVLSRRRVLLSLAGLGVGVAIPPRPGGAFSTSPASNVDPLAGTGFVGQAVDLVTLEPVAHALVEIPAVGARTSTDASGSFVLPAAPGIYTVRISAAGYFDLGRTNQTVMS